MVAYTQNAATTKAKINKATPAITMASSRFGIVVNLFVWQYPKHGQRPCGDRAGRAILRARKETI
jgi:hypothetical protein